jgi:threonine 3-dehydrogenase
VSDTMWALTFDRRREDWATSTGMVKERVPVPVLDEQADPRDASRVLVRVRFAGFCGSDRGIWSRKAFGDLIEFGMNEDGVDKRIFGHEMLGEVVAVGSRVEAKYGYRPGEVVSAESHVVCGVCVQCRLGEHHVCSNDRILGIGMDGCFAEYVKVPAKILWRTDLTRIRPEVAAVQEPFGNAVHACQVTDLRGKTVAILGTGTIGLFAVLIAKGMGARRVIGIEPDPHHRRLAAELGCDDVIAPGPRPEGQPWAADPALRAAIDEITDGVGVDVAMEMSGHPAALNDAIHLARRGGHVVLFGVRNGDATIQDFHRVVMNGLQLHGVVGRRIFGTWHITRALLEQRDNGVQDAIWRVILRGGEGTVTPIADWNRESFEATLRAHTKPLIQFS